MKRILILIFSLSALGNSYAQEDLFQKFAKQAVLIDSLKKVIKLEKENGANYQTTIKQLRDTVKNKENSIKSLELVPYERKKLQDEIETKEADIQHMRDSIASLKSLISKKEKQVISEKQKVVAIAKEEREKGKNELLTRVVNTYRDKSFDDLLTASTKEFVQQDLILVGQTADIEPLLSDIILYFNGKEILENRFDNVKIENSQNQLNEIQRESALVDELHENLSNYQMITDGFKETVKRILSLDRGETVSGMPVDIQNQKLSKILSEISLYIFNYDINLSDFPYLSDLLIEIIKRKHPDPDADISDFLEKL